MQKKKRKKVLNEKDVKIDSFKVYKSSDDNLTKEVDGKKEIEDFHIYKENKDEEE